jgi:hypothetical protein
VDDKDKVIAASNMLEEMAAEIKEIVLEIRRTPIDIEYAYARVYNLRRRLGRDVVQNLGYGIPKTRL